MTLTPWFNARRDKPVRPGVYKVASDGAHGFARWDGRWWFSVNLTPEGAARALCASYVMQDSSARWRGIWRDYAPAQGVESEGGEA